MGQMLVFAFNCASLFQVQARVDTTLVRPSTVHRTDRPMARRRTTWAGPHPGT